MGFTYLNVCSYWRNVTSPLTCLHKGTAFQFDMKDPPQAPVVFTELGTDVVLVTMGARIVQAIISLGRNALQKRALYWKIHPRACMNQILRAVVWVCWSVVDLFLPLLMTTVYIYKDRSGFKDMSNTEQPMNTVTVKCHWGSQAEPAKKMIEELCSIKMETVQEVKMGVDCKREKTEATEVLPPSCTNTFIMSMVCMPLDSSEESEVDSIEELEEDFSQEDTSVDSGMQESWTPKSKCGEDDYDEESDWSDEDSWDEESNPSCNEDEALWASFCHSDDPYNPLSFAMPTRSPEMPKKDTPIKSPESPPILGHLDMPKTVCVTVSEKQKTRLCKKPVLSGYKSSHECTSLKEESPDESDWRTKKVRFSPKVTVHPIITWSFAHRMARKGPWEEYARDRSRFQRRIAETEAVIGFSLDPRHREKIWSRLQSEQN